MHLTRALCSKNVPLLHTAQRNATQSCQQQVVWNHKSHRAPSTQRTAPNAKQRTPQQCINTVQRAAYINSSAEFLSQHTARLDLVRRVTIVIQNKFSADKIGSEALPRECVRCKLQATPFTNHAAQTHTHTRERTEVFLRNYLCDDRCHLCPQTQCNW